MSITPINAAAAAHLQVAQQQPLDIAGLELKVRTLVVEASAGTGKTTAISDLTVRALGEGFCRIDQVMLVTFTIKAAAELRTRVHSRLATTINTIRAGGTLGPALAASHARDPEGFLANLQQAAAQFDQATITTTHSFCQTMLLSLGIHVDHDPGDTQSDTLDALMAEIADDLFLQDQMGARTMPSREATQRLVDAALHRERVVLHERSGSARAALAERARVEFERRKRTQQIYGFDDMTHRLAQALATDLSQAPRTARSILASRYRLVMVDEFQDTDQQQWQLVHDAFHDSTLLVLIGDPKQSIYRFRGADVQAYVAAAADHQRFSLQKNYRSSRALLSGVEAVLNNAQLGRDITTPTGTADPAAGLQQAPGQWTHPVQLRLLGTNAALGTHMFDAAVADLVAQTRELFDDPPHVQLPRSEVSTRLRRRDVAVLVRSRWRSDKVAKALTAAGIPAVQAGADGVFKGEAGRAWAMVLDMLLNVTDGALRRAALTPLVGWDIPGLVEADETRIDDLARTVRELSQVWLDDGFAAMSDALFSAFSVHERLLQQPRGVQLLSDLLQVAEMAHDHALSHRASPEAVRRWLVEQTQQDAPDVASRVGADIDAIQVMTMHSAKGLGFPVVMLPDLFDPVGVKVKPDEPRLTHDGEGRPLLDVSEAASTGVDEESFQEELRLAYVAMTRAQVALRLWWGASKDVHASALHRLLVNDTPFAPPASVGPLPVKGQVDAMVHHLGSPRFAPIHVHRVPKDGPGRQPPTPAPAEDPLGAPRRWTRSIDRSWRRTSYSGLTAALHELGPHQVGPLGSGGEHGSSAGGLDEPDLVEPTEVAHHRPAAAMPSPMSGIPGGADFGTLVHAILEHIDPQAADLPHEVTVASAPYLSAFGPEVEPEALVDALVKVFHSPLGSLTGGTLADLPATDRLAELDFELTMGSPDLVATVGDLAALFSDRRLLPASDPLAHYGRVLAATPAAEQTLNGFLNGSIDAVLRVGSGPTQRFVVVDYKTNTMPLLADEELTVQHYNAKAMTQAMVAAHYPLQALLYSVALHRLLGWRLPGYDPGRHLGGVGYLFVRGMAGPDTPELGGMPAGVFTWRPPAGFVQAADTILGGPR